MQHEIRIGRALPVVALVLGAAACTGDSDEVSPVAVPVPVAAGTSAPTSGAIPPPTAGLEVTAEDAVAIALDAVGGGQVLETDLDEFEVSIQVWEVTVRTPEGVHRQISIDMRNGSVIGNETDD